MNGPAEQHDESSWDLLASELGLEPATKNPIPPAAKPIVADLVPEPQVVAAPKSAAPPEAVAMPEVVTPAAEKIEPIGEYKPFFSDEVPKPHAAEQMEEVKAAPFGPEESRPEGAEDTVLEEGLESSDGAEEGTANEGGPEGDGTGRRRRRRRRRKKSGAETPINGAAPVPEAEAAPVEKTEAIVAEAVTIEEEDETEAPFAEIVGEAASELEDDDDSVSEAPHAAIEELEEDSAEPLPEWKVTAWTDLIATLYRPQDR